MNINKIGKSKLDIHIKNNIEKISKNLNISMKRKYKTNSIDLIRYIIYIIIYIYILKKNKIIYIYILFPIIIIISYITYIIYIDKSNRIEKCLKYSNQIIFNHQIKPFILNKKYNILSEKKISEFFINTSHNSYIPCNQNFDIASSEMIKRILKMGCY